MSKLFPKMVDRLHRIDQLTRMKATGQPHELANMLRISPSTLYEYIDLMRNVLSAPIKYCHNRRSYIYEEDGKLLIGFINKQKVNSN